MVLEIDSGFTNPRYAPWITLFYGLTYFTIIDSRIILPMEGNNISCDCKYFSICFWITAMDTEHGGGGACHNLLNLFHLFPKFSHKWTCPLLKPEVTPAPSTRYLDSKENFESGDGLQGQSTCM